MTHTIDTLAQFAAESTAASIPMDALEYTKLVLCDTVLSGICTGGLERGDMARRLAQRMGGEPEALVLGSAVRSSVLSAGYANADLMNLLDADETFFNGAHFAAMSFGPALAVAEQRRRSGADLLRAAAISFDINARLNLGTSLMEYDGDSFRFSQLSSHGYAALGAAVAMGLLTDQDSDQMADAMGLATWLAPTAKNGYMRSRRRFNSLKYAPNGQIAHAGMTASMMVAEGYEGDRDSLDTTPGFLEAQGYRGGDRSAITAGLGDKWWITETSVKPYPACRFSHAAIDAVRMLRRERGIRPEDIVGIDVALNPAAYSISQFREPQPSIADDHIAPFAVQFHMPTLVALALHDVPEGPMWHRPDAFAAAEVRALAEKVTVSEDPVLAEEWRATLTSGAGEKVRRTRGALTLHTAAGSERVETDFALGDPWEDSTRVTWDLLGTKLSAFADGWMESEHQRDLLEAFRTLDTLQDVATDLVPLLVPSTLRGETRGS